MDNFQQQLSDEPNVLKIIVVGDTQVGKSSLITRYFDKKFHENNVPTVGLDFRIMKKVKLNTRKEYQISIWDTAGQEQFRSIVKFFCKGSDGALVCFDLNDPKSIEGVPEWVNQVQQHSNNDVAIVLVGTKMDKMHKISEKTIENLLSRLKLPKYFLTSSKTQEGVEETFQYIFNEAAKNKFTQESLQELDRQNFNSKVFKKYKLSSLKQTQIDQQETYTQNNPDKSKSSCC